jgi:hypothetical protein
MNALQPKLRGVFGAGCIAQGVESAQCDDSLPRRSLKVPRQSVKDGRLRVKDGRFGMHDSDFRAVAIELELQMPGNR